MNIANSQYPVPLNGNSNRDSNEADIPPLIVPQKREDYLKDKPKSRKDNQKVLFDVHAQMCKDLKEGGKRSIKFKSLSQFEELVVEGLNYTAVQNDGYENMMEYKISKKK